MGNKKKNRKCIICGKEYSYCPVCGQDLKKPSWFAIFCSDNCNSIYETVTTYRDGGCTVDAARDILTALDLSAVDNEAFNSTTRNQIKDIMNVKVENETGKTPVNEVIDETVDEVVDESVADEQEPVVEKVKEVVEKKDDKKKFSHYNQNYKKHDGYRK